MVAAYSMDLRNKYATSIEKMRFVNDGTQSYK